MSSLWQKRLASTLLGVAGVFGLLAPASAVIVTTNYDPNFGPGAGGLANYGWRATVNYEIPGNCFSTPWLGSVKIGIGGTVFNCGFSALSQPFKVLTAEVGIYAKDHPTPLLDVMTFDPTTLPLSAICVDQGALDCVYSVVATFNPLAIVPKWSDIQDGNVAFDDDYNFRLGLIGEAVLQYQYCPTGTANCTSSWMTAAPPTATASYINTDANWQDNTKLRVGAVPEPASLALVMLALGAAGLVATRRR